MTILNFGLSLGPLAAGLLPQYSGATSADLVFGAVMAVIAVIAVTAVAGLGALSTRAVRSARWPETVPASLVPSAPEAAVASV